MGYERVKRRTFPLISGHGLKKEGEGEERVKLYKRRSTIELGRCGGDQKKKAGSGLYPWWSSSTFANAQMVYIPSWQEFQEAAENLYEKSPNSVSADLFLPPPMPSLADTTMQTRYCVKWKSSEAKLVLKITDNTTVRPFLAFSSYAFI